MRHHLLLVSGSPRLVGFGASKDAAAAADVDAEAEQLAAASLDASAMAPSMASERRPGGERQAVRLANEWLALSGPATHNQTNARNIIHRPSLSGRVMGPGWPDPKRLDL